MVRCPVSGFAVRKEPVRQNGEEIVADVLAGQPWVAFDELASRFSFLHHPVHEVQDFHIRAVEDRHLPGGSFFHIVWGVLVQGHDIDASGSVSVLWSGERLKV